MTNWNVIARQARLALPLLLSLSTPIAGAAQAAPEAVVAPTARSATRAQLEASAAYHERMTSSPAYSDRSKARARAAAALARRRLADGDFRVGERIHIQTGGSIAVNDTFTVLEGRRLAVTGFAPVGLAGVLRSELETRLLADMVSASRNATVTAHPLMRIAVFGAVTRPGYFNVPQEMTLDQVLYRAGGPVSTAAVDKMRMTRGDTVLLTPTALRTAVAEGRTLDALGLEDGDALAVPLAGPPWDRNASIQLVGMLLMPLVTIFILR